MLTTTFFEFSASDLSTTTAYIFDMISDLEPLILLFLGLFIAMDLLKWIIMTFRMESEARRK